MKAEYAKLITERFSSEDEFEGYCGRIAGNDEPWSSDHPTGFTEHKSHVTLFWGGIGPDIYFYTVDKPHKLLDKIAWIIERGWEGTTPARIHNLMECVARNCGWHGYLPIENKLPPRVLNRRRTTDVQERSKLTPTLRYKVLVRDKHTCQACGATVATGAILHIDHILSISHNGRTIEENLQTLCSGCNQGKGAR